MTKYVSLINLWLGNFVAWQLEHVPRSSNEKADALAVVAASLPIKEIVLLPVYYQPESSITTNRVNGIGEIGLSWMTSVARYLCLGKLPDNRVEACKVQVECSSSLSVSCINGLWAGPILNVSLNNMDGTY